jgi:predicted GNAT family acetyltransferase
VSETRKVCLQMTWERFSPGEATADICPLGEDDAADMLALATLTKPGPFRTRTHTMGRFVGVREGGRLIAMAGERLHAPGYREITAVCTHPDVRGRGLGAALMRVVGQRMIAEGDQPFLHSYASNEPAIALYRRLGFEVRTEVVHAVWKRS